MFRVILAVLLMSVSLGCVSGSESGGIETGNAGGSNLAAAVGSLFAGDDDAASLKAQSEGDSGRESACEQTGENPDGVTMSMGVAAGTYGMTGNTVTLAASDGCDQGGEFATFNVSAHGLTCTDGDGVQTTLTMQEGTGVFREKLDDPMRTEIYGTFNLTDGTSSVAGVRCSLTIDHSSEATEGQFGGGCEDASGTAIEQNSDTVCEDNE